MRSVAANAATGGTGDAHQACAASMPNTAPHCPLVSAPEPLPRSTTMVLRMGSTNDEQGVELVEAREDRRDPVACNLSQLHFLDVANPPAHCAGRDEIDGRTLAQMCFPSSRWSRKNGS